MENQTAADVRREAYSGKIVMLDDKPAEIVGYRMRFATVRTLDIHGPSFQWSWDAVERIVAKGGHFHS